eukprot:1027075-Heterocapsa_arctica.AAC.1
MHLNGRGPEDLTSVVVRGGVGLGVVLPPVVRGRCRLWAMWPVVAAVRGRCLRVVTAARGRRCPQSPLHA